MNFLTTEYVAEQAKLGEIPALECSLKHHEQGRDATKVELINALDFGKFNVSDTFCACCQFAYHREDTDGKCDKCPLNKGGCCGVLWNVVDISFDVLKDDYSNANFSKFRSAEAKLCTYIKSVLERKRAEQKKQTCNGCKHQPTQDANIPCGICDNHSHWKPKESKPALRHGDYGHYIESGGFWCVWQRNSELEISGTKRGSGITVKMLSDIDGDNTVIDGNYIVDLARNAEDLTEFSVNGISVHLDRYGVIHFGGFILSHIDEQTKFYHKFGQLLATAKRKQKSK